jgi:Response regulators consisting of a CheY-like receiver domain and a winged-helix DNA-binding domain
MVLQEIMLAHGSSDVAQNGEEAIRWFSKALEAKEPYDVIILDIMMPEMDGMETLERIRNLESKFGFEGKDRCKIVMCTALDDYDTVMKSFQNQCDAYLVKPISKDKVNEILINLELIS